MSEPTRLLDELELSDDERRALTAGLHAPVPGEARSAVWSALGRRLPLAAAGVTLGATATKTAAAVSLVKLGLAGALVGAVTAVGVFGAQRLLSPAPPRVASSVRHPAPVAPRAEPPAPRVDAEPNLDPMPELPQSIVPPERPTSSHDLAAERVVPESPRPVAPERSVASFLVPAPTTVDGGASLESRRVAEARSALRSGNAQAALTTLTALGREVPNGVLAQEREALIIEALLVLGEREQAKALAKKFLSRYPGSPHASSARRALGP